MGLSRITTSSITDGNISVTDFANTGDVRIYSPSANTLVAYTTATERLRIDASGNLLVGTTTQATGALLTVNGSIKGTITSNVAVASTSGTSIDFTGIPSWVKRITVMCSSVSTTGTTIGIQVGTSSGVVTSGYLGSCNDGGTPTNYTTMFLNNPGLGTSGYSLHGFFVLVNLTGNVWCESHMNGRSDNNVIAGWGGGSISLASALTRVRITTVNGTDTFDAGSINILYE